MYFKTMKTKSVAEFSMNRELSTNFHISPIIGKLKVRLRSPIIGELIRLFKKHTNWSSILVIEENLANVHKIAHPYMRENCNVSVKNKMI